MYPPVKTARLCRNSCICLNVRLDADCNAKVLALPILGRMETPRSSAAFFKACLLWLCVDARNVIKSFHQSWLSSISSLTALGAHSSSDAVGPKTIHHSMHLWIPWAIYISGCLLPFALCFLSGEPVLILWDFCCSQALQRVLWYCLTFCSNDTSLLVSPGESVCPMKSEGSGIHSKRGTSTW